MKRVLLVVLLAVCLMFASVISCAAMEVEIAEGAAEEEVDWLTDLNDAIKENKDDVIALCLALAGILFEAGVIFFYKKIWPKLETFIKQQSEKAMEMAKASGQITQTNKNQFDEILKEVKSILTDGSEREQILLKAMETETKTKEEYKALCEQMMTRYGVMVTALIAQEQMTYETLMSAKLTDVRKEEIEKQHLQSKALLEAAANSVSEAVSENEAVEA